LFKLIVNPFNSGHNSRLNIDLSFISCYAFEWKSGIRRNLFVLIPLYLLFLLFSFRPYVAPVGLIILSVVVSGFYLYGESRDFMEIFAVNPKQFLLRKIKMDLKYLMLIYIPIILLTLIFQIHTWYYLLGALIVSILIQIIAIIFKYALFMENSDLSRNSMIVFLNIVFIIVPLFWLVPLVMGIRYYFKAKTNIKKYIYD
jgi:hypothetical protein